MSKLIKNISIILFLFVGTAILAHSIIPHDHHYELGANLEHHNHQNGQEPIHCHYLNHIDLDKVSTNNFQRLSKQLPALLAVISFDNQKTISDIFTDIAQTEQVNLSLLNVLLNTSPTRGSPVVL